MAPKKKAAPKAAPAEKAPAKSKEERMAALAAGREKKLAEERALTAKKQAEGAKKLAPLAHEINVRMEKARQQDEAASKVYEKADDHRLAAALRMKDAKEVCDNAKISWKEWAQANITQWGSYEYIQRLRRIGESKDPLLALADLRAKTRKEVAAIAKKNKATKAAGKKARAIPPSERAIEALQAMRPEDKTLLLKSEASGLGMEMVDAKKRSGVRPANPRAELEEMFWACAPKDQMAFLKWAANEVGMTLVNPMAAPKDEADAPEMEEVSD